MHFCNYIRKSKRKSQIQMFCLNNNTIFPYHLIIYELQTDNLIEKKQVNIIVKCGISTLFMVIGLFIRAMRTFKWGPYLHEIIIGSLS